jgi:DNA-directed RNA polymerase specialized sigma24 family protein
MNSDAAQKSALTLSLVITFSSDADTLLMLIRSRINVIAYERCYPDPERHRARRSQCRRADPAAASNDSESAKTGPHWNSRRHFFAAAAEAMRRILVERARARGSFKRGGGRERLDLDDIEVSSPERSDDLLALDEALTRLAQMEPQAAELVQLRYFAGQTMSAAAEMLGLSLRSTQRLWAYAKAWLLQELERD